MAGRVQMTTPFASSDERGTPGGRAPVDPVRETGQPGLDWRSVAADCGVDLAVLPRHVAIIMDGNGRWAKGRGVPRALGHKAGVEAVRATVRAAHGLGLEAMTLYSFSSENWRRPAEEVHSLMGLLRMFIRSDLKDLKANNVRIEIIGERGNLAPDIIALLDEAESDTAANTGLRLVIAFNYGSRDEIVRAVRRIAGDVAAGRQAPDEIGETAISAALDTAGVPDPDLLIRTSGEQRISNFLLWQCAYAEFVFLDVLWPDFSGHELIGAIKTFQARERRFGGRPGDHRADARDPDEPERAAGSAMKR